MLLERHRCAAAVTIPPHFHVGEGWKSRIGQRNLGKHPNHTGKCSHDEGDCPGRTPRPDLSVILGPDLREGICIPPERHGQDNGYNRSKIKVKGVHGITS